MEPLLEKYCARIETALETFVEEMGDPSPIREACAYALLNGGKRFRPAIVLMVAEALGDKSAMPAALAIECFHTASLVADDLPCMDDDDMRRSKPSVHKNYNEATALLVSYALIAAGYGAIAINAKLLDNDLSARLSLENASYNTGLWGATGGQFLDLFPPDLSEKTIRLAIHRKTVSLFEVAFVFGWLFGGGDPKQLDVVKRAASHYGMAFQFADDMEDMAQDAKNGRLVNIAAVCGLEKARELFHVELESYFATLRELKIDSPNLIALGEFLFVPQSA